MAGINTGGFVRVTTNMFFDRKSIVDKMDDKERRVLSRVGAYGRGAVSKSIRQGKKAGAPTKRTRKAKASASGGKPPTWHVRGRESLKDRIFFGYDRNDGSVVIGPEKFNAVGSGLRGSIVWRLQGGAKTIPELLEKGGTRLVLGRGRRGIRYPKPIVQKYKPHPYTGPSTRAFQNTVAKMQEVMQTIPL